MYKNDKVTKRRIHRYLNTKTDVLVLNKTTSTNTFLKEQGSNKPDWYTIIANRQTSGRGRHGHSFYSPQGTGVYMSILIRPKNATCDNITTIAAVAACRAIEAVSGSIPNIKWVNDIFLNGRKVCGILTEAVYTPDGELDFIVLGVGFNAYPPKGGFPEDIQKIAGAIFEDKIKDGKCRLAAEFINFFMDYYKGNTEDYVEFYRKRCFVIGKSISVITPNGVRDAVALDIDNSCGLIVRYSDGGTETLSSGEVSIKAK